MRQMASQAYENHSGVSGRTRGWSAALLAGSIAAITALACAVPASGATTKPKPEFRLGDYRVKTSPGLESFTPTIMREPFVMEFKLAQTTSSACGGPKGSKREVYCLAAAYRIGEYGTESTNGNPNLCSGQGDPVGVVSYGWMPVLILPSSGRVSVNTAVLDQGKPAARVKATIKITPRGRLTGTYKETNYVSTGGPNFLGCTTGTLKLSGKWDAPA
jgi:hypothetical protein